MVSHIGHDGMEQFPDVVGFDSNRMQFFHGHLIESCFQGIHVGLDVLSHFTLVFEVTENHVA
ncbi:hypothetical protein D3C80_1797990 [compost metagenome]